MNLADIFIQSDLQCIQATLCSTTEPQEDFLYAYMQHCVIYSRNCFNYISNAYVL